MFMAHGCVCAGTCVFLCLMVTFNVLWVCSDATCSRVVHRDRCGSSLQLLWYTSSLSVLLVAVLFVDISSRLLGFVMCWAFDVAIPVSVSR